MVQGAAFQYEIVGDQRRPRRRGDLGRHRIVVIQQIFSAPAVEAEGGGMAGVEEDRAGVAQPDIAEAPGDDLHACNVADERAGGRQSVILADHQLHPLGARPGQGADQGGHLGLGVRQVVFPELGVAREPHPHGAVGRPFGGDGGGGHGGPPGGGLQIGRASISGSVP